MTVSADRLAQRARPERLVVSARRAPLYFWKVNQAMTVIADRPAQLALRVRLAQQVRPAQPA